MPACSCRAIYVLGLCLIILLRLLRLNCVSLPVACAAFFPLTWMRGKQAKRWINCKLHLVLYNPNSVMFKHEIQVTERELSEALRCTRKYLCANIFKIILSSLIPGTVCVMSNLGWLLLSILLLGILGKSFHWESYVVLLSFSAYFRDYLFFQWFARVIMLDVSSRHGSDKIFKDSIWQYISVFQEIVAAGQPGCYAFVQLWS